MAGTWTVDVAWDANQNDEEFDEAFGLAWRPEWRYVYGSGAIDGSGNGYLTGSSSVYAVAHGAANGIITVTFGNMVTSGTLQSIAFRHVNRFDSWYLDTWSTQAPRLRYTDPQLGGILEWNATGAGLSSGDVVTIELLDNSITVKVNGIVRIGPILSNKNQTAPLVGLVSGNPAMTYANFQVALRRTDITPYVYSFETKRGRTNELDRAEVGELKNLRLKNEDRRFEPEYAGSPYYPYVGPGRQVRVLLDGQVMWRGWFDEWPEEWWSEESLEVELEAAGALATAAQTRLQTAWDYETEQVCEYEHPPLAWYPLDEDPLYADVVENRAKRTGSTGNGWYLNQPPARPVRVSSLVPGDEDGGAYQWDSEQANARVQFPTATNADGAAYSVEMLVLIPKIERDDSLDECHLYDTEQMSIMYRPRYTGGVDSKEGRIWVYADESTAAGDDPESVISSINIDDGKTHHLVVQVPADDVTGIKIWIDGVNRTGTRLLGTPVGPWESGKSVHELGDNHAAGSTNDGIVIDEVRIYDYLLDTATIAAHYTALIGPTWRDEYVDQRARRVAQLARFPDPRLILDVSQTRLQTERFLDGKSLLDYLRVLEASEGGVLFEQADGRARLTSRYARHTDATSSAVQATFGDLGGTEQEYERVKVVYSLDFTRTVYEGNRVNGRPIVVENTTARNQFGRRAIADEDLRLRTDAEVADKGNYLVATHGQLQKRVTELIVHPVGSTDPLWTTCRQLEIGHRVAIYRRPSGSLDPDPFYQECWVEGVAVTRDEEGDTVFTFYLAPAEATLMRLDTATLDAGRLGW